MTEQELWLDPARAHRAGVDLAHAGRAIAAHRDGLGAEIAAASAERPWGRDDVGSAFDQQYREFEATVLSAWRGVGGYVQELGADVALSVEASVDTDTASRDRIQQALS